MSMRRIWTIFNKDFRDAIRDARVLVALLVPLGIGLFYSAIFDDDTGRAIDATVVFYAPDQTELPEHLLAAVGESVNATFLPASTPDEVRQRLRDDRADLGLILTPDFDEAVRRERRPGLEIVQPTSPTLGGEYMLAALDPALRALAGEPPPAEYQISAAGEPGESANAIDKLGLERWSVLASVVAMIAMIALLAVPVILAEENEKRTLDALVMIASYREVVTAKALLGVVYIVAMIAILFGLTRYLPERLALFGIAAALAGVSMIGCGLLLAGLFKSANQLNTWAGVFLVPALAPTIIVGLPAPDGLLSVATAIPTGAAMALFINSASSERIVGGDGAAFAALVVWGVLAYAALLWQLSRRQA